HVYRLILFQTEDVIRDVHVTEVQTCALPIYTVLILTEETFPEFKGSPVYALLGSYPAHNAKDAVRQAINDEDVPGPDSGTYVAEIGRASCMDRWWVGVVYG